MDKVYIIFWTQSGNTGAMASAIGDGVKEAGKEPVLLSPSEANIEDLKNLPAFAMGCPAMGAEVLEEGEMEPFVSEVEKIAAGKSVALFGSYGWGDGQWMRDWEDRMSTAGANVIDGEGLIVQEAPGDDEIKMCQDLGKTLAGM
ncbi:MAG TPA: flavodoxin [Lachnospiraceae bacterium]|nr:flavodoxin [uncultured Lachnoclostridium sp.]HAU84062.1 flavodoxin [Lachnospiraceae bacterium]